ncbi:MAG: hypothetical protein HYR76_04305 [Ignavibacteria bacterium]|nr:hypothetical protein [Ignavibacteria bacterium]
MKYVVFVLIVAALLVGGCKNDPIVPLNPPAPVVAKAIYVLNEGNFGQVEARLSVYDVTRDTVYRDVFEGANHGQHLGSTGDDMKLLNGKAYILMSGSENLDVISLTNHTLLQSANLPGNAPHDLLLDSARNRAYVTRLYKSSLYVLNLSTLAVLDSIAVGSNPQGMVMNGNDLLVCNSGYGSDSTVSVIDATTNMLKTTVRVGQGPTSLAVASNGKIWIACTGNAFGTPATNGSIFILKSDTYAVEDSIVFTENLWGSIAMGSDGSAYVIGVSPGSFFGGPMHKINTSTKTVTMSYISGNYYSMGIDGASGDIYLADAKNFSADGIVNIFSKDGTAKKTFAAQKGPGVIAFKY